MPMLEDRGERMVPELHSGKLLYAEHYTRYAVATRAVTGKRVLDIACGSGYGSAVLGGTALHVTGVDVSQEAVDYAIATYGQDNVSFVQGDATSIPLADDSVDVVVSFETIEHIEDYRAFIAEIDRVLAPDGFLLLSTPNDLEFVEDNHFHLHQFVYDELLDLVKPRFAHVEPHFQATWSAVAIGPQSMLTTDGPISPTVVNLCPLPPEKYLYFYLICSRVPLSVELEPMVALGGHYSDRALHRQDVEHERQLAEAHAARVSAERALAALSNTRSVKLARRLSTLAGRIGLARSTER